MAYGESKSDTGFWFKHSAIAGKDEKIMQMIDDMGKESYFYFFTILEMCTEKYYQTPVKERTNTFKFHTRFLRDRLRINTRKLNIYLVYLQDKFNINSTYIESSLQINIPNLPKYMGNETVEKEKEKEKEKENILCIVDKSTTPKEPLKIVSETIELPLEEKPKKANNSKHREKAKEILELLNKKASKKYRPVNTNLDLIISRLKEGYEFSDFEHVISNKSIEWLADEKMNKFLRPKTLFSKTNFANYTGEEKIESIEAQIKAIDDEINQTLADAFDKVEPWI
jgi:uncharacterized phage protein (TIGR02220 family)